MNDGFEDQAAGSSPSPDDLGQPAGDTTVGYGRPQHDGDAAFAGPRRIGQYHVLRKLGEGGMGVVYEARQENPHRRVAVKVVRGGFFVNEESVRSFKREIETLARFNHPNIATIYESGCTDDGSYYFAMELVDGETLADYMAKRGPADSDEEIGVRLKLFGTITDAVHYAHQRGVIHRDLKPSNIMVVAQPSAQGDDSTGRGSQTGGRIPAVKLLDFGLARIVEGDAGLGTSATDAGQIKGTLAYMSPEQARGDPAGIDVRTDVYALGVILYEMLAGVRPYEVSRAAIAEAVRVICEEAPQPLRRARMGTARLDQDIETIVLRSLEKDRDQRYDSAAALAEDVSRYLTSQPILARAPSATYQLRKFAARNRALVGAILAGVIVLIAGAAVSTAFGIREASQRRLAEQARSDLEAVVEFQSGMLDNMDPEGVGRRLIADLRQRIAAAGRTRGWPERRIKELEASFSDAVTGVNSTDLALRLIDEEILGRATKTISERFKERPLIDARLRDTIGETYSVLGLYRPAEAQLRQALEKRRDLLGSVNPDTLLSTKHLSFLYMKQGRYKQALDLAETGLELHRRVLGEDNRETLASAYNLALIYAALARHGEAERLLTKTLAVQRRVLGETHTDTMNSMSALGASYREQGRVEAAEKQNAETLELRRRVLGPEHAATLESLNNLATVLAQRGRHHESAALFSESLAVCRRVHGEEHPDTLSIMENLAIDYSNLNRYAESEKLQLRVLELRRRVLGTEHPATLISMNNLSILYFKQGRRAEAEKLDRENLATRLRVLGEDHSDTLISMNNLAVLCRDTGRSREAETLFQKALEIRRRVSGFSHPATQQVRRNLIALYEAQGRVADLRPLVADKLEAERMNAQREGASAEEMNEYAWDLLTVEPAELRDPARALEVARRACAKEQSASGPNLWNYLDTLALAFDRNGNLAEAIKTEKQALSLLSRDRPERAGLLQQLAGFEARLAKREGTGSDPAKTGQTRQR